MQLMLNKESGFGMVMVMVVIVLFGIFATIFARKIGNQAKVSKLMAAMNYRDAVLAYYYHITANRHSYSCTRDNVPALKNYVTGTSTSLPQQAIDIYNVISPCEVLIPSTGLGFKFGDGYPVANPSSSPCSGRMFCLRPEVRATGNGNEVEIILTISFTPDHIEGVSMAMKDESRSLFFNQTIQQNCSTSSGERAITSVVFDTHNNVNEGVNCSPHTLITPPQDGGTYVAQCPQNSAGGQTAVLRFDPSTGLSTCSPGILLAAAASGGAVTGALPSGHLHIDPDLKGGKPSSCGSDEAATGIRDGEISGCTPILPGPSGPAGNNGYEYKFYLGRCQPGGGACSNESNHGPSCPSGDTCVRAGSCGLTCYTFDGSG